MKKRLETKIARSCNTILLLLLVYCCIIRDFTIFKHIFIRLFSFCVYLTYIGLIYTLLVNTAFTIKDGVYYLYCILFRSDDRYRTIKYDFIYNVDNDVLEEDFAFKLSPLLFPLSSVNDAFSTVIGSYGTLRDFYIYLYTHRHRVTIDKITKIRLYWHLVKFKRSKALLSWISS